MASHAKRIRFRRGVLALLALGGAAGLAATLPAPAEAPADAPTAASAACRIPDDYLRLAGDLDNTEAQIRRRAPVRVVVLASAAGGHQPLEAALQRRMPDVDFTVEAILSSGLAEEDALALRRITERLQPDLVVWQVGVRDAIAASDVADFGRSLDRALAWVDGTRSDLLIVDPPFVPRVQHEGIYGPYVGEIAEAGRSEKVPVLQRYAFMRYLSEAGPRAVPLEQQMPCTLDLIAEAISRALR